MKIEAGKFYKDREGRVWGPMVRDDAASTYVWDANGECWDDNGEFWTMYTSQKDLIQECTADVQPMYPVGHQEKKPDLGFYGAFDALYGAATDREALLCVVGMLSAGASAERVLAHIKAYLEGKQ